MVTVVSSSDCSCGMLEMLQIVWCCVDAYEVSPQLAGSLVGVAVCEGLAVGKSDIVEEVYITVFFRGDKKKEWMDFDMVSALHVCPRN